MCCRANVTVLYILAYLYNNELLEKKTDYLLYSENTHIILGHWTISKFNYHKVFNCQK